MWLHFLYRPGDDGKLARDEDHTALAYAYYQFTPRDPKEVIDQLLIAMVMQYGSPAFRQSDSGSTKTDQFLWTGADGTMIALVRSITRNSDSIYIKYGFEGADVLLKQAYEAQ